MGEEYKLYFDQISKVFPGVLALDHVSFGIKKGSIHVVMGENGAGKSTLMKIIDGTYPQTDGSMYLDGKEVHFSSTRNAIDHGVAMVHQELQYMPDMTLERYLMLGREPQKHGFIDWKAVSRESKKLLADRGMNYDLKKKMREFTVSEIQLFEITRTISGSGVSILILDEPTSALSSEEVDRLFENIEKLKREGITIIYISHKMDEIFRIADYITVMRDGRHIHTAPASEFTHTSLVRMMVGREIENVYPEKQTPIGDVRLEVKNLSSEYTGIKDISFNIRAGEIVGLGGLMGAGRTEAVRAIFGLDKKSGGEIIVDGKSVKIENTQDAVNAGIALATEDRRRNGLVLCRPIKENATLACLKRFARLTFIHKRNEEKEARRFFDKMRVKAPGIGVNAETLSGGNQQKVVLAKWLMTSPKVLILDEPTRGIDVGAKYEIYKLMIDMAQQGLAVLMISSELPEFIGMCDRAYIMFNGKITGELTKEELNQDNFISLSVGGEKCS